MNPSSTPNSSSRHLPNSSPAHNGSSYATALKGASLAFQRTGPSPNPSIANASRDNGALIAATSASRDHSRPPSRAKNSTRISRQTTGNSVQDGRYGHGIEHGAVSLQLAQLHSAQQHQHSPNASLRKPPGNRPTMADPRTTSFIAATLAASRSASSSPKQHSQPHAYAQQAAARIKRKNSVGAQSVASSVTSLDLTDTASIAPMNSLISMFEKSDDTSTDPVKKGSRLPPLTPARAAAPISNKPEVSPSQLASTLARGRAASPPASIAELKGDTPHQSYSRIVESKRRPLTTPTARASSFGLDAQETDPASTKRKPRAATPPRPISRSETVILSPQPRRAASHKMVFPEGSVERELDFAGSKPLPPAVKPKPKARPKSIQNVPINSNPATSKPKPPVAPPRRPTTASSNDTFLSASSGQSRGLESPERGRSRNSAPMLPSRARPSSAQSMLIDTSPRRQNPVPPPPRRSQASASTSSNLPLNSLTNATMAGILASSRATPSIKSTPLPPAAPPLRRQTPRLRQTLRKPSSRSDEEDEYHARFKHRKKPLQKSKHSHHEGARRRWREEITLRERKRYEGVWASNRGLLLTNSPSHSPDPISLTRSNSSTPNSGNLPNPHNPKPPTHGTDLVSNVIVRDMWARSRLPFDELSEVWDLVDTQGRGVLDKTEFVVGMWLVDQRLRGRKIPQKVMGSVWGSAKGLTVESPYREKGRGRRH